MVNLNINYLGLELKNPLIVGACTLTTELNSAKQIEEAGAAAIVLKSLFEEQIQIERFHMDEAMDEYAERNAEMTSLFPKLEHSGPKEYLLMLENIKKNVSIPVITSLNCLYDITWVDYAKLLEEYGADAIELNFYVVPDDIKKKSKTIEDEKIDVIKKISAAVKIPISVKLSAYYTNALNVVNKMENAGAKGFVLFNRLFQPEIDVHQEKHVTHFELTNYRYYKLSMRYIGLLYNRVKANLIGSGGVYVSEDMIQLLLSGASAVQIVSALYRHKPTIIKTMLHELENWMKEKGYTKIDDFKGKLSDENLHGSLVYKRAQYLDYLLNTEEIVKKYVLR